MSIVPALPEDDSVVAEITHRTIERIYPHYYPRGAVAFFHQHHSEDASAETFSKSACFCAWTSRGTRLER